MDQRHELKTPGKRLRAFAETVFTKKANFARALGYKQPASLYDYFNDRKTPGRQFLARFAAVGGNPDWLRTGLGDMFADNEAGKILRERFGGRVIHTDGIHRSGSGGDFGPTREPSSAYGFDPLESEDLYVLISRILFRLRSSQPLPLHVIMLYRERLADIERTLMGMTAGAQQH